MRPTRLTGLPAASLVSAVLLVWAAGSTAGAVQGEPQVAVVGGVVGSFCRSGTELAKPSLVVPFRPHADLIAPLVGGQRDAALLEDAAMRFVFRRLAIDQNPVEVEHNRCQLGHTNMIVPGVSSSSGGRSDHAAIESTFNRRDR